MKADFDDSNLELFADVLTITLSMLLLVAVILAINSTIGDGSLSLLKDPDLVTELKLQQIEEANRQSDALKSELALSSGLNEKELRDEIDARILWKDETLFASDEGELRQRQLELRRRQREVLNVAKLEIVERTVQRKLRQLEGRRSGIKKKIEAAQARNLRLLRERENDGGSIPFYVVFKNGKAYPLSKFEKGRIARDRDETAWIEVDNRRDAIAKFPDESGYDPSELIGYANELAKRFRGLKGRRVVAIAFPDSFPETREFLRTLSSKGLPLSWEPWEADKPVVISASGRMPLGPQ